jgi:hypothetical protein
MAIFPNNQLSAASATPAWQVGISGSPMGFQQLAAGDLAAATSLTVPPGAHLAEMSIEGGSVRWRDDTVAPTASVGVLFASTQPIPTMTYSAALNNIQFIASSGSPILNVSFYG